MLENTYLTLIYRKLEGTISPEEATQLDAWVSESIENQKTLEDVEAAWEASANLTPEVELDLDAEFAFLEERIEADEAEEPDSPVAPIEEENSGSEAREIPFQPQRRTPAKRRLYWLAAAGFALLVAAGILAPRFFGSNELEWVELTADNGPQQIKLEDGTVVNLEEGATLRYPKTFAANERPVDLTGESTFSVAKDADRPFRVRTNQVQVTVLGTEFVVNTNEGVNTSVNVYEGKVEVMAKENQEKVILVAGQSALWNPANKQLAMGNIEEPQVEGGKKLAFEHSPMPEVVKMISDFFGKTVELQSPEAEECTFNTTYTDPTFDEVMNDLSVVLGFEVETTEDGKYILKGGAC